MKTLSIGCLIFVLFLQYGFSDETLTANRIVLTLDNTSKTLVKGSIAPIEYTQDNFHVTWDALANLRVAEPEKFHSASVFQAFLPTEVRLQKARENPFLRGLKGLLHENLTRKGNSVSVGEVWQIEENGLLELLRQFHPNPNLDMHLKRITGIAETVSPQSQPESGRFPRGVGVPARLQRRICGYRIPHSCRV